MCNEKLLTLIKETLLIIKHTEHGQKVLGKLLQGCASGISALPFCSIRF